VGLLGYYFLEVFNGFQVSVLEDTLEGCIEVVLDFEL
jgi:hypothetical protein